MREAGAHRQPEVSKADKNRLWGLTPDRMTTRLGLVPDRRRLQSDPDANRLKREPHRTVRIKYIGQRNGTLSDDLEIRDAQVKRRTPVLLTLQKKVLIAKW